MILLKGNVMECVDGNAARIIVGFPIVRSAETDARVFAAKGDKLRCAAGR